MRFSSNASANCGLEVGAHVTTKEAWVWNYENAALYFATNNTERLRIAAAGNVGIASTTPWRTLSVTGTVGFDGLTGATGAGSLCLDSNKQVVYNSASDACLSSTRATKHAIENLSLDGLRIVDALQPVSFIYSEGDGRTRYGFIAEDTANVDAHLATYNASGTVSGIHDRSILAVLVSAIKSLGATVVDGVTHFVKLAADKFTTQELCVDDVCVTRDQFAEVFGGSQGAAAAGAPTEEDGGGAPASSPASGDEPRVGTTTTPAIKASSTPAVLSPSSPAADTLLVVDTPAGPEPTPALEPANDNTPSVELGATGTE